MQAAFLKMSEVPDAGAGVTLVGVVVAETVAGPLPAPSTPSEEQNPSSEAMSEYADDGRPVAAY